MLGYLVFVCIAFCGAGFAEAADPFSDATVTDAWMRRMFPDSKMTLLNPENIDADGEAEVVRILDSEPVGMRLKSMRKLAGPRGLQFELQVTDSWGILFYSEQLTNVRFIVNGASPSPEAKAAPKAQSVFHRQVDLVNAWLASPKPERLRFHAFVEEPKEADPDLGLDNDSILQPVDPRAKAPLLMERMFYSVDSWIVDMPRADFDRLIGWMAAMENVQIPFSKEDKTPPFRLSLVHCQDESLLKNQGWFKTKLGKRFFVVCSNDPGLPQLKKIFPARRERWLVR